MQTQKKLSSLPPVKVSDKMKTETLKCAEIEQENTTEYMRKAIELRNAMVLKSQKADKNLEISTRLKYLERMEPESLPKEELHELMLIYREASKDYVPNKSFGMIVSTGGAVI